MEHPTDLDKLLEARNTDAEMPSSWRHANVCGRWHNECYGDTLALVAGRTPMMWFRMFSFVCIAL